MQKTIAQPGARQHIKADRSLHVEKKNRADKIHEARVNRADCGPSTPNALAERMPFPQQRFFGDSTSDDEAFVSYKDIKKYFSL